MTKKESKAKYLKFKRDFKKNKEVLLITSSLGDVKELINKNILSLEKIQTTARAIVGKSGKNPDQIMDSLPAENLRELAGDFSKKITFKDIGVLTKMHRESGLIMEEQENLARKQKILDIELLQKKIEVLLDDNE